MRQPQHLAISIVLLGLAQAAAAADHGRLKATGGLMSVEGSAGGGLVPWSVLAGLSSDPGFDWVVGASHTEVDQFGLSTFGAAASWNDRFEVSLARQSFRIDESIVPAGIDRRIKATIVGAKLRVAGDLIYGRLPQMALGLQYKRSNADVLAHALGARRLHDFDGYFSVTRLILDGPFHRNWLLNGTVRATRGNETGLLGFGTAEDDGYTLVGEASTALFLNPEWALGAEYRQKPDGIAGLGESDWYDLFVAYVPNEQVSIALAWVDLGTIAGQDDQNGLFLSLTGNF